MINKILYLGLMCCLFAGCQNRKKTVDTPVLPLDSLFAEYHDERSRIFPLEATEIGDTRYNHSFPNTISEAYRDTQRLFFRKYLDQLKSYDREELDPVMRTSYDILKWDLELNIEGLKFPDHLAPITQFWSMPLMFGQLGSGKGTQPFKKLKDYEDFAQRMEGFRTWCDTAIGNMKRGINIGYTNPKVVMERTLPQLNSFIVSDVAKSVFYEPVKNMPADLTSAEKKKIDSLYKRSIAEIVIPSYKKLHDFIRDEYIPKCKSTSGIGDLPGGKEQYAFLIRYWTTTNLTADQVFDLGQKEVQRIRSEMEKVKTQMGFTGDLKAFFDYIKTDRQFFPFNNAQEVLDTFSSFEAKMEPQLKKLFKNRPKTSFEIRRTEAFREASASIEYQAGTEDGKRPGIFYVPVPDVKNFNKFNMESMFLHEAIPGHHYQMSLQRENPSLSKFRKYYWTSAYGEGWALYTESLGKELGLYTDPVQYFGALSQEMHRAIRLVVDAGMHAKGWTRVQAIQFSLENEGTTEANIIIEIERYMAIPGQALSYKIGQLKIQELRAKAEKELGSRFDIAKFHDTILSEGCLPLFLLESKINDWIAWQKK